MSQLSFSDLEYGAKRKIRPEYEKKGKIGRENKEKQHKALSKVTHSSKVNPSPPISSVQFKLSHCSEASKHPEGLGVRIITLAFAI